MGYVLDLPILDMEDLTPILSDSIYGKTFLEVHVVFVSMHTLINLELYFKASPE